MISEEYILKNEIEKLIVCGSFDKNTIYKEFAKSCKENPRKEFSIVRIIVCTDIIRNNKHTK